MPRETGASSNPETRISIEVLRVTGSPAFAGDDTDERMAMTLMRELSVEDETPARRSAAHQPFTKRRTVIFAV
jgi:hypothetical protein